MDDERDETVSKLNAMLRRTPYVPSSMVVQPREDLLYLYMHNDTWSPTLHAWRETITVDLMRNARDTTSDENEIARIRGKLVDGDMRTFHEMTMVSVREAMAIREERRRAGALLGLTKPARGDDIRHLRIDRHVARMINGFGDDARECVPEMMEMLLESGCDVVSTGLVNQTTARGQNFSTQMKLVWRDGHPIPLFALELPASAQGARGYFDGTTFEISDLLYDDTQEIAFMPETLIAGMPGRMLGNVAETGGPLDGRRILEARRYRTRTAVTLSLTIETDPVAIDQAGADRIGREPAWQ